MKMVLQSKKFESKNNLFVVSTDQENLHRFVCLKSGYDLTDIWLPCNMFETFMIYQHLVARKFRRMQKRYDMVLYVYTEIDLSKKLARILKKIDDFLNRN
jgi:hypothetical protein